MKKPLKSTENFNHQNLLVLEDDLEHASKDVVLRHKSYYEDVAWKVHAQRKFAQGAYVPPSTSERRPDPTPSRDDDRSPRPTTQLIYSNMPPAHLIDMISMYHLHKPDNINSQPIVLVERLYNQRAGGQEKVTIQPDERRKKKSIAKQNGHKQAISVRKLKATPQVKKTPLTKKFVKRRISREVMHLRSKPGVKLKQVFKGVIRLTRSELRKHAAGRQAQMLPPPAISPPAPAPGKRRGGGGGGAVRSQSPTTSGYSTDDDTPLNQISAKRSANKQKTKPDNKTDRKRRRSGSDSETLPSKSRRVTESTSDVPKTPQKAILTYPNFRKSDLFRKIKQKDQTSPSKEPGKGKNKSNLGKEPEKVTDKTSPSKEPEKVKDKTSPSKEPTKVKDKPSLNKEPEKGKNITNTCKEPEKGKDKSSHDKEPEKGKVQTSPSKEPAKVKDKPSLSKEPEKGKNITNTCKESEKGKDKSCHDKEPEKGKVQTSPRKEHEQSEILFMMRRAASAPPLPPCPLIGSYSPYAPFSPYAAYAAYARRALVTPVPPDEPAPSAVRVPPAGTVTPAAQLPPAVPAPQPSLLPAPVTPRPPAPPQDHFKVPLRPPKKMAKPREPPKKVAPVIPANNRAQCRVEGDGADVYAFEEDASGSPEPRLDFRQNPRKSKPAEDGGEQHYKYFDLPQDSSHVIQLASVKKRTQEKRLMRARLVPKTVIQVENTEKPTIQMENRDKPAIQVENREKPTIQTPSQNKPVTSVESTPAARSQPIPESSNEQPSPGTSKDKSYEFGKKKRPISKGKGPVKKKGVEPAQPFPEPVQQQPPAPPPPPIVPPPPPPPPRSAYSAVLDAPVFHPTEAEFENPFVYLEKISALASKFGVCKIVPPAGFKPDCFLEDDIRFEATNQYPGKMFSRWGPATRELCAIKTHLATQGVTFSRPPLVDSMEVNLPKLYHIVQAMGGLKSVIEYELWSKVAEEMNYPKGNLVEKKLDQVYVKCLLPYDTLAYNERSSILARVEQAWCRRYKRMLERAARPLHKQRQLLHESSEDDDSDDSADEADGGEDDALADADDCVVAGRLMSRATFQKIAKNVMQIQFPSQTAAKRSPTAAEVEQRYWQLVVTGSEHVCVNTGNLDTGKPGYGFTKNKADPYSRHPWNLKVLAQSSSSMLRSLGPVLSVTVPTLHLGMVFSTSCWHRDPHGLPWIEYMHQGPPKIWYGIPDEQTDKFRSAVEVLCPAYCQNKAIWLPTDITMIPPHLLLEHNVSLSRTTQSPGEFIVIFPKAYSCSVCTGHTVSESVYYAPTSWLDTMMSDFEAVRASFEPTMFSCEQLLIAIAMDSRAPAGVLATVQRALAGVVDKEIDLRRELRVKGIAMEVARQPKRKWNEMSLPECDVCRSALHLSMVTGLVRRTSRHCLQHALRLLAHAPAGPPPAEPPALKCFYTSDALHNIMCRLHERLPHAAQ